MSDAVSDESWADYVRERDAALASKLAYCPRPPCADQFVEALKNASHDDVWALWLRMSEGLDEETAELGRLIVVESLNAARAATHGRGMVIRGGDSFRVVRAPIYRAMRYLYGVLAWHGLSIQRTKAGAGRPSVWRVRTAGSIEAGRRINRSRVTMWDVSVPRSAARDRAERLLAWLAVEFASMIDGTEAPFRAVASPCSAGDHCLSRAGAVEEAEERVRRAVEERDVRLPELGRRSRAARSVLVEDEFAALDARAARLLSLEAPPRCGAEVVERAKREIEAVDDEVRALYRAVANAEFMVGIARVAAPAETVGGRRGAREKLCAACRRGEKSVRNAVRRDKGYADPLRPGGRLRNEKDYRWRLEQLQSQENLSERK